MSVNVTMLFINMVMCAVFVGLKYHGFATLHGLLFLLFLRDSWRGGSGGWAESFGEWLIVASLALGGIAFLSSWLSNEPVRQGVTQAPTVEMVPIHEPWDAGDGGAKCSP